MSSRIRYGLLISLIVISLFVMWFGNSYAGSINYIYDELRRLYQVFDPQGNVTTYNYDAAGNLLSVTRSTGAPVVTGISPNSARARDTIGVTIPGNYLLINTGVSTDNPGISVSNVKITQTSIMATFSISWLARQGLTTVTVSNVFGSAQIAFTVTPPVPIIDALSPASGPVTRLVKINGTGFSNNPSENLVRFNGVIAPVYSCTPIEILTSVPVGATSGPVTVTTNGGVSNGVNFTVTSVSWPPPTIASITPNVDSVEGGGNVTIIGSGFTSDTKVYIDQKAVTSVTVIDVSTLRIITAPGVAGTCNVLVTNINGDAFLPGGFTYFLGPQKIVSINPPAGLTNIPINTLIAVLFIRPVDRTTISSASFSLVESNTATPVQGTFSFDFDDRIVIFAPQSVLKPSTGYTLSIATSIKSADGIPLDQAFSGSFITAGVIDTVSPKVTTVPADKATGVPMNTNVVFIFSEPMNPASLNSSTIVVTNNGMPVSGNITLNRINTGATFLPFSNFLPNSLVNVALSSRVTDMAGNRIVGSGGVGNDFISSFTTASTTDTISPSIVSINPPNGAAGIDPHTTVSVTFSEPINPVTVNSETFTISVGGVRQSGRISFSGQNTIVTFTPDQTFPTLSLVAVTLLPGISDMAGNFITSTFTSSFTTRGEPRLVIGYPGPTTLTLGDTINIEVTNTGDLDTSSTYTVKLSDKNEVIIYQNTIFDTIQAGASKTYSFQISNQAADSDYTLYAEVIDSRNIKTTNSFGIKIIGLNAALSTRTDKNIYLPTELITGISNILNGQFGIEDGSLKVSVSKTSQSATGQFTHFLPKTGWWLFSGPSGVAIGSDGSIYVADTYNSRIQKFDSSGNFIVRCQKFLGVRLVY